jgi:hypothetical protein
MNKDLDFIENDEDKSSVSEYESDFESGEEIDNLQTNSTQDMDTLIKSMTFEQAGKPWPKSDDEKLKDLYLNKRLNVIQIADIFKRGPNGIICRLGVLNIIKEKKYARGYFDYIKYKEQFKKIVRGRKPKNQINQVLQIKSPAQTQVPEVNLVSELLELNNNFNKKIDKLKSEYSLELMQIISKYNKLNTTDPNCEIINIGLKKYILKNGQVYNIVTGSLYGMYDSASNKCVKI